MSLKGRFKRAKVLQIIINRIYKGLHNCKPLLPIYLKIIFIHYLFKQANCICCTNNNFKSRKMYPIKIQMYTIKVINEKSENIKIYVFLIEKQVFYLENQKIKYFRTNAQLYILKLLFKWHN